MVVIVRGIDLAIALHFVVSTKESFTVGSEFPLYSLWLPISLSNIFSTRK